MVAASSPVMEDLTPPDEGPRIARPLAVPASRLSRLARLGSMTAGVAGSMATDGMLRLGRGERPSVRNLLLTPGNIQRIADQLAQMRGAAMKIGQLVSMDTGDFLPPELAQIMSRLRQDADFMPPSQLKSVLNANWSAGWQKHFAGFDTRPIAAASIGQVHRARLRDGRDLAIKVQYPGIARSIDSDVANVGALLRMSRLLPKGFDIGPYLEEARKQLHEETDYALEGRHLARFGALLADQPAFEVPERHADWSTRNVLAMTYLEGTAIEAQAAASQEVRDRIATDLTRLVLREMFEFGVMQTDPNFANYRYGLHSGRIQLLDFGATRDLPPSFQSKYRRLLRAGIGQDRAGILSAAEEIGFLENGMDAHHRDAIAAMMELAFDALRVDEPIDLANSPVPAELQARSFALAESGFVPPPVPMDVLFVQRKLAGVFLLGARLRARLPLRSLLQPYLGI